MDTPIGGTCGHCGHPFEAKEEGAFQCSNCLHWFHVSSPEPEPERLQQCEQCGRRSATLINGKCYIHVYGEDAMTSERRTDDGQAGTKWCHYCMKTASDVTGMHYCVRCGKQFTPQDIFRRQQWEDWCRNGHRFASPSTIEQYVERMGYLDKDRQTREVPTGGTVPVQVDGQAEHPR